MVVILEVHYRCAPSPPVPLSQKQERGTGGEGVQAISTTLNLLQIDLYTADQTLSFVSEGMNFS